MTSALPVATLNVFIILIQPITFCLFKHGRHGILGWLTIQVFCGVRIVGSILQMNADKTHATNTTTILILNNVGLSPLLLGALGVLHEARTARNPNINAKLEWFKVINFHGAVIVGMVLIIIGILHEIDNKTTVAPEISKVGMAILLVAWCILAAWVFLSLRKTDRAYNMVPLVARHTREPAYGVSPAHAEATTLLYGTVAILPFIASRDIDAALNVFLTSTEFKNSETAKIILSVIPEMIVVTILSVVGIMTRHISKLRKYNKDGRNIEMSS